MTFPLPRLTRTRPFRSLLSFGLLVAPAVALASGPVAPPAPRIMQPVNNQQRITLEGNVRHLPARARDLGEVSAGTPASRVQLLLQRSPEQESALETFITDVHTPGNPEYHQWMTPSQFGAQFGPADSDVQAVVAWLQSQGFAVARVNAAKTAIEFSGTAAQIESAFATRIHSFELDGVNHVANVTNPKIPAALKPVVAGLSPLNDFRARPMHSAPRAAVGTPAPTSSNPHALTIRPVGSPELNTSSGGHYLVPADAATIYDVPNASLNPAFHGTSLTGSGVTIGIAGTSNVDVTNVANYRNLFGLPPLTPSVIVDGTDPGVLGDNAIEALLDLEMASAIAPQARLDLYISQATTFQDGLFLAIQRALDDNQVNILNVSFGACEAFQGTAGNQQVLNYWQQAAAQGISVTVSTGDSGAAGCDSADAQTATLGLQVNGLASTPYNIAVGGTDFNQTISNEGTYWNTTNAANYGSAKSYIPEIPWNNSTTTIGGLSGNSPTRDKNSQTRIDGAGGGASGCLTGTFDTNGNLTGCKDAYAKPSWQTGSNPTRTLPDVSLFAANGGHDSAWVICASGLGRETSGTDCVNNGSGINFQLVGGTSASAPAFAGVLALVTQQLQAGGGPVRLGQANFTLYPLAAQHASVFHDVTTGNISVVCSAGSLNCGANGFLTGFDAGAGYDEATGLGSVDVAQLVQNWTAISFRPTSTALSLNGATSPITIQHGTAVNIGVAVTSSGGTPTGSVALEAGTSAPNSVISPVSGSTPSPSILTLSNGTVTGSYPYLPGGTYAVTANYAGDGIFGGSVSNGVNVTVTPEPSQLGLFARVFDSSTGQGSSASSAGGIPYGTYVSVAAQPVSSTLPATATYAAHATGTVSFLSSSRALNAPGVPIDSDGIAEIPNQQNLAYPPGNYSVSATYSGDPSFTGSSATAVAFTIVKNSVTINSGVNSSGATVVEVDPVAGNLFFNPGFSLPTGTVALLNSAGATVGTANLAVVNTNQGAVTQATIPGAGAFASISYSGDGNYNGGTASATPSFAVTAAGATLAISRGASGTSTISVTPQSGFTGTVNLTCSVTGTGTPLPTCSLAKATVTLGSSAVTDVLTVGTGSGRAALHLPANPATAPRGTWYAAGGVTLAGLLLFGIPGRRRNWQRMLGLVLFVSALGLAGCGGGSSGGGGGGGSGTTPAGNYTVTVTATSGSVTQTTMVAVSVQ